MGSTKLTEIVKKLNAKNLPLFTLSELGRILAIDNDQNLYKRVQRLEKSGILKKLTKGRYQYLLKDIDDFQIANFLYQPSYVSLQSALSFHSVMTGFTYEITSVTAKKTNKFEIDGKIYSYSHLDQKLFFGWEKVGDFLIARPEKALLDYLYLGSKGILSIDTDEIDMSKIDRDLFIEWSKKYDIKRSNFKFI